MSRVATAEILSEDAIAAGVRALERLHGHHLEAMTDHESADARHHWREQVERILEAVAIDVGRLPSTASGRGRAVLSFVDDEHGSVQLSAAFSPRLREVDDGDLDGTPAQILAIASLQAFEDEDEDQDESAS